MYYHRKKRKERIEKEEANLQVESSLENQRFIHMMKLYVCVCRSHSFRYIFSHDMIKFLPKKKK